MNSHQSTDSLDTSGSLNKDANTCIALGVGVAGLGTAAAVVAGAVCPLCYIVAPGLIGAGVIQKSLAKKRRKDASQKSGG